MCNSANPFTYMIIYQMIIVMFQCKRILECFSRFLLDLSQIPSFADRTFCLIFQSFFSETIGSIESRLNNIRVTSQVRFLIAEE